MTDQKHMALNCRCNIRSPNLKASLRIEGKRGCGDRHSFMKPSHQKISDWKESPSWTYSLDHFVQQSQIENKAEHCQRFPHPLLLAIPVSPLGGSLGLLGLLWMTENDSSFLCRNWGVFFLPSILSSLEMKKKTVWLHLLSYWKRFIFVCRTIKNWFYSGPKRSTTQLYFRDQNPRPSFQLECSSGEICKHWPTFKCICLVASAINSTSLDKV